MKIYIIVIATLLFATTTYAQSVKENTAQTSAEPITIEFGNMKSEKPNLLDAAKYLKGQTNGTTQYASQFVAMMRQLNRVGIKNLSQSEKDLLLSVSEPTDEAMKAYIAGKQAAIKRADERSAAIAKWIADGEARKLAEAKLAEEKRQAEAKARQEQEKIAAMNRQAAAQERQAAAQAQMANQMYNLNSRMDRYYRW